MKNLTKTKAFWATCLLSILLFMFTCWSALFSFSAPYWVESCGYFILTYLCIEGYSKKLQGLNPWMIGFAAVLGQLVVQIPARLLDFHGSLGSLMIVVSCIMAIMLAVICHKDKKPYSFILSYIIMAMFNCIVPEMWNDYVLSLL